jgi:predicted P-loop ATPase
MSNKKLLLHWAIGTGKNFGRATNKIGSWGNLQKLISEPTRTKEKRYQFDKLNKTDQDRLKAVEGWISGAQCDGKWRKLENVQPRDLMTLDVDYAHVDLPDDIANGDTPLSEYEFATHSSRRHTEEAPRLRMFIPMSRDVSKDEYPALVRIVSWLLEGKIQPMVQVDKVSARGAQMMFLPTASVDGDWFYHLNEGELLDPDDIFELYENEVADWRDISTLPKYDGELKLRESSDKAEDPTLKRNIIGDFCRAYDVEAAMEKFLPGVYEFSGDATGKPRYTYSESTSSNGAVVEDGGLFLYSHHGHDPVCEQLVNAFDLVRIHLFGAEDVDTDPEISPAKTPSFKAMLEHIKDDREFKQSQAQRKYDVVAMFEDVSDDFYDGEEDEDADEDEDGFDDFLEGVEDTVDTPKKKKKKKKKRPHKDWFSDELEFGKNGAIMPSLHNIATLVHCDARMFGAIAYNEFDHNIVALRSIKSNIKTVPSYQCEDKVNGDRWQDFNDISIRAILESPNGEKKPGYGMKVTDRDLVGGVLLAARRNSFHPVKDYWESLEWDGVERVERLLVDYIGAPDTAYFRSIIRLKLIATVTRVYEPGHKFDYAIFLSGPQGCKKSTFVKTLCKHEKWFGEMDARLDDRQEVAEQIGGKLICELPEGVSLTKSSANAAKAFMRREDDDVRMAYDRRVSTFKRQCVFWGTTNDAKYLKDPTGNRSYWPAPVLVGKIDIAKMSANIDQIWAEAYQMYLQMRVDQPHGILRLTLGSEAIDEAKKYQESVRSQEIFEEWAERITDYADQPVRLSELLAFHSNTGEIFTDVDDEDGTDPDNTWVVRCCWTQQEIQTEALGLHGGAITNYQQKTEIEKTYPLLEGEWERPKRHCRRFGKQLRWWHRKDCNALEHMRGYKIVENPEESDESEFSDIL